MSGGYARTCAGCTAAEACKHFFAAYWEEKSHGGVGCNAPISDAVAKRVLETLAPKVETVKNKVSQLELL